VESPYSLVLLSLIALATVTQAAVLLALLAEGRRLTLRVDQAVRRLEPHLRRAADLVEDAAQVAEGAARRLPQIETAVDDALRTLRHTTDLVEQVALRPLRPLARGLALWRGLRRGIGVYRAIGPGRG
jgi:ABC-type transporter Mla subunit MlaD